MNTFLFYFFKPGCIIFWEKKNKNVLVQKLVERSLNHNESSPDMCATCSQTNDKEGKRGSQVGSSGREQWEQQFSSVASIPTPHAELSAKNEHRVARLKAFRQIGSLSEQPVRRTRNRSLRL